MIPQTKAFPLDAPLLGEPQVEADFVQFIQTHYGFKLGKGLGVDSNRPKITLVGQETSYTYNIVENLSSIVCGLNRLRALADLQIRERKMNWFYLVDYNPKFDSTKHNHQDWIGGDNDEYYVNLATVREVGSVEKAFEHFTHLDRKCILYYSLDEIFRLNENNEWEEVPYAER